MNGVPGWVGPTMAISLIVIALSFMVMGGVVLVAALVIRSKLRALQSQLAKVSDDAKSVTTKLKNELSGFVDISSETREKLRDALDIVQTRLQDLDALVEVLQAEAEETALDAAAFLRTVRGSRRMLGAAFRRRGRG